MKLLSVLLFFSTLALGQEYDSGLGSYVQLSDFVRNVHIPAIEDPATPAEVLTQHSQTLAQMANDTQILLANDLEEGRVDYYGYARNLVKVKELVAQVTWYRQGLDVALNILGSNMGPILNSNLEFQLLESAYAMIRTDRHYDRVASRGREVAALKKIAGHLQFMRDPNPDVRHNNSSYLLTLSDRLMEDNQEAEALTFMETFFQKAQTCGCMRPITVTNALEKYNTWITNVENRPPFSASFNTWYNSLLTSPEQIVQPNSISQEVAYQREIEILIQDNLNKMLSSTDL